MKSFDNQCSLHRVGLMDEPLGCPCRANTSRSLCFTFYILLYICVLHFTFNLTYVLYILYIPLYICVLCFLLYLFVLYSIFHSISRLEICRDRRDRRSCKIFVSCVNLSKKQRDLLLIWQVYTHLNANFIHNC